MNQFFTNPQDVAQWLDLMHIKNYIIQPDASVHIAGNVNLVGRDLSKGLPVNFASVSGTFNCSKSALTSLLGSPRQVGKNFECSGNFLTSLDGISQTIIGRLVAQDNQIDNLEALTQCQIGGSIFLCRNRLTSLLGSPSTVHDDFYCVSNFLTDLAGAPRHVAGSLNCQNNQIISLKGCPETVELDFICDHNALCLLDFIPNSIGAHAYLNHNPGFIDMQKDRLDFNEFKAIHLSHAAIIEEKNNLEQFVSSNKHLRESKNNHKI